ncbi:L domain-like protein, partial [Lichtheimia hyalospora FSU 10163]
ITTLPDEFGSLGQLRLFNASHNRLQCLPDSIGQLERLKALNVSYNALTALPETMPKSLMVLIAHHNALTMVPAQLSHTRLVSLHLDNNPPLVSIPVQVVEMPSIRKLVAQACGFPTEAKYPLGDGPLSLKEICARRFLLQQQLHSYRIPRSLARYLASAKTCSTCKGPYFEQCVTRGRMIERSGSNILIEYRLCSPHWNTEEERLLALFTQHDDVIESNQVDTLAAEWMRFYKQEESTLSTGLFPFPLYASSFAYEDIASYPRYRVVLTGNRIAESDILDNFDKNERSVVMMSAHGQPFECTIPEDDNNQEHHDTSTTPSEEDSIERGLKLLEPLSKQNCLYYPTPGYWTYEYCHDKHVRQFHLDRNALQGDQRQISAASNSPSQHDHSPITSLRHVGDQRYLVQQWTGGTKCDLTGKPRSIEIQFHCDMQANDRISMFQEVATCQYQMTITTPRLCEEMMLASTSHSDVNKIECNPIVPDHLVD